MYSKKALARISLAAALIALLTLSFRIPASRNRNDLSVLMEPDGSGTWSDVIQRFNDLHPDARIRMVEGPPATNTREDMYSTAFLSQSGGYDVVFCDVVWVPKFAAAGWLLDLSDRLPAADRQDFLDEDLKAGSYRGRLYRVPAFTDAGVLYYRKDLVADSPATFDDLKKFSERFKDEKRWGFLWQGKQYEGLVTNFLEVLWGYGGDWIDAETKEVFLDRPEALLALQFVKSTIGTISPPGVTTYSEEESRNLFQDGRAVFLRNWLYVWALTAREDSPVKGRVGLVPMVHAPGKTSRATLGGWGFAISRFTSNPEAAWKFVEFITRPDQLQYIHERLGRVPARKSLVPPEFEPILRAARPRPAIPEYAQASDILQRWLSAALSDRVSPEFALREAARETRLLVGP